MKKNGKKSDAMSGLKMVGGVAAGAAAGSLMGPIGAAVGAVVGGIAGAKVDEITGSQPVKQMAHSTKTTVKRTLAKAGLKTPAKKAKRKTASTPMATAKKRAKRARS